MSLHLNHIIRILSLPIPRPITVVKAASNIGDLVIVKRPPPPEPPEPPGVPGVPGNETGSDRLSLRSLDSVTSGFELSPLVLLSSGCRFFWSLLLLVKPRFCVARLLLPNPAERVRARGDSGKQPFATPINLIHFISSLRVASEIRSRDDQTARYMDFDRERNAFVAFHSTFGYS